AAAVLVRNRHRLRHELRDAARHLIRADDRRNDEQMIADADVAVRTLVARNRRAHALAPFPARSPRPRMPSMLWTCTCCPAAMPATARPITSPYLRTRVPAAMSNNATLC